MSTDNNINEIQTSCWSEASPRQAAAIVVSITSLVAIAVIIAALLTHFGQFGTDAQNFFNDKMVQPLADGMNVPGWAVGAMGIGVMIICIGLSGFAAYLYRKRHEKTEDPTKKETPEDASKTKESDPSKETGSKITSENEKSKDTSTHSKEDAETQKNASKTGSEEESSTQSNEDEENATSENTSKTGSKEENSEHSSTQSKENEENTEKSDPSTVNKEVSPTSTDTPTIEDPEPRENLLKRVGILPQNEIWLETYSETNQVILVGNGTQTPIIKQCKSMEEVKQWLKPQQNLKHDYAKVRTGNNKLPELEQVKQSEWFKRVSQSLKQYQYSHAQTKSGNVYYAIRSEEGKELEIRMTTPENHPLFTEFFELAFQGFEYQE